MSLQKHYDYIVVGSGAGGAGAAYRLTCAGKSVLLVEKGGELPTDGSTLDPKQVVRDGKFLSAEEWEQPDGKTLKPEEHFNIGGKTRWYGAAVLRFDRDEFKADPTYDCDAFPIGLDDLAPYYEEAERLLGARQFSTEPTLEVMLRRLSRMPDGWRARPLPLALDINIVRSPHEAAHFDGFVSVAGLKGDAKTSFLDPIADRLNFTLMTNAEVVQLLGDVGQPNRITGVRLRDGREFHADAILLAAGALHSPRLLARYLASVSEKLQLPCRHAIGTRLKMHLLTALVAISPGIKRDVLRKTVLLTHSKYPHSSVQPLGFDGDLISTLIPALVPRPIAAAVGRRAYGFFLQTEDGSSAANKVSEVDRAGTKIPIFDYDAHRTPGAESEHRRLVQGFQRALLGIGAPSFTQRIGLSGTAHVCGTLAAGVDPTHSVVDARGRVHGMESLYVVDGSILSRSSRVNPSLTIFAWALRVADLLAARDLTRSGAAEISA